MPQRLTNSSSGACAARPRVQSLWMSLWMPLHLFGHPVLATGTYVSGGFCGEDSQHHYAEFAEFVSGPFFFNWRRIKIAKTDDNNYIRQVLTIFMGKCFRGIRVLMENVSVTLDLGGFLSEDVSEDVCAALCVRSRGRKLISKTAVS